MSFKPFWGHKMSDVENAVTELKNGVPVGIPTETVYGLAADTMNPLAIRRVFALKERPLSHPLIVHVNGIEQAERVAQLTPCARDLIDRFWPGPLSLILPRNEIVPDEVTAGLQTVAVRCPKHPLALSLLSYFELGLVAPSANKFGQVSPTTAAHVRREFSAELLVLDGGSCEVGIESTILDLSTQIPAIRRPGTITKEVLEALIGPLGSSQTAAPGTHAAHYAPHTSLLITDDIETELQRLSHLSAAVLYRSDSEDYAHRLYAELRRLDSLGVDVLIAEKPNSDPVGRAVLDRLLRAEHGSKFSK